MKKYIFIILLIFLSITKILKYKTRFEIKKSNIFNKNSNSISIILPVLNNDKTINETIKKIKNLNLKGELILIDQVSTDDTSKIIYQNICNYDNPDFIIKIYHTSTNNRNKLIKIGFREAICDNILILDINNLIPENISLLVDKYFKNDFVMLIEGNKKNNIINRVYGTIFYILYGVYLTNGLSYTRILNKKLLNKINLSDNNNFLENELNIKLNYFGKIAEYNFNNININIHKIKYTIHEILRLILSIINIFGIKLKKKNIFVNDKNIHHMAIILDGNRRYSKNKNMLVDNQHLIGLIKMMEIISFIKKTNINHLTLYTFAEANWKRDKNEIKGIMNLINYINIEYAKQNNGLFNGIKINILSTDKKILKINI